MTTWLFLFILLPAKRETRERTESLISPSARPTPIPIPISSFHGFWIQVLVQPNQGSISLSLCSRLETGWEKGSGPETSWLLSPLPTIQAEIYTRLMGMGKGGNSYEIHIGLRLHIILNLLFWTATGHEMKMWEREEEHFSRTKHQARGKKERNIKRKLSSWITQHFLPQLPAFMLEVIGELEGGSCLWEINRLQLVTFSSVGPTTDGQL